MSMTALLGYVDARMAHEKRALAFQCYVSDALRVIGETLARSLGGSYLTERFVDMVRPQEIDARTGDEIVEKVLAQMGFSGGEKM